MLVSPCPPLCSIKPSKPCRLPCVSTFFETHCLCWSWVLCFQTNLQSDNLQSPVTAERQVASWFIKSLTEQLLKRWLLCLLGIESLNISSQGRQILFCMNSFKKWSEASWTSSSHLHCAGRNSQMLELPMSVRHYICHSFHGFPIRSAVWRKIISWQLTCYALSADLRSGWPHI